MDPFLKTLFFAYFTAEQKVQVCKERNQMPKQAGAYDAIKADLEKALEWQAAIENLLITYVNLHFKK